MSVASGDVRPSSARRVVGNTFYLFFATAVSMLVRLALTPPLVQRLGMDAYGLWTLLTTAIAYLGLLDFGISATFPRWAAECSATGRWWQLRQVTSIALLYYLVLGLVLAIPCWLVFPVLLRSLHASSALLAAAPTLAALVYASFFVSTWLSVLQALLVGLELFRASCLLTMIGQLMYAALVLLALDRSLGVGGVAAAGLIQASTMSAVAAMVVWRQIGSLFASPKQLDRMLLHRFWRFGGWMQVGGVCRTIHLEADRLIIGMVVSLRASASYDIGNRVASLAAFAPQLLLGALLPRVSALITQGDAAIVGAAYRQIMKWLALLAFAASGFVVVTAPLIVATWLNGDYPGAAFVCAMLIVTTAVNMLTGAGTIVLRGEGSARPEAEYGVVTAVVNVAATLALTPRFGLAGVVTGTLLGSVVGTSFFLIRFHRARRLPLWQTFGAWLLKLTAAVMVAGSVIFILARQLAPLLTSGRESDLLVLLAIGLVYMVSLLVTLVIVRFFEPADLALLRAAVPAPLGSVFRLSVVQFAFRENS